MSDNPFATPEPPDTTRSWLISVVKVTAASAIVLLLAAFLLLPVMRRGTGDVMRRTACRQNLRRLALAVHEYSDHYGCLPPAYTVDGQGRPLHSWRTLLLPLMGEQELYQRIDLSKAWNDPVNMAAGERMPDVYQCPSVDSPGTKTTYLGNAGVHGVFSTAAPRTFAEITDGTSRTLLLVEVPEDQAVHWMSPRDADAGLLQGFHATADARSHVHDRGYHIVMADGTTVFIADDISSETIAALLTIDGGESLDEF